MTCIGADNNGCIVWDTYRKPIQHYKQSLHKVIWKMQIPKKTTKLPKIGRKYDILSTDWYRRHQADCNFNSAIDSSDKNEHIADVFHLHMFDNIKEAEVNRQLADLQCGAGL